MDDNNGFNDRVSKVFGSITSSSSSTNAPWSLTDAQIERKRDDISRYRNRDIDKRDDDETPVSSSFCKNNLFNNRQTDGDSDGDGKDDDDCDNIRSSIGLDPTLDYEEEEDAYDKMAEGRENAGDRLFMKDVTDHGPYLNSHNILPTSTYDVKKDPRANHDAAKTRRKQDDDDDDEPMLNAEGSCASATVPDDGITIKSILKRKNDEVAQPRKRVRFDPNCKNHDDHLTNTAIPVPEVSDYKRSVPDYIMNPSKYTRYELHESSHDESNTKAYLEFLDQVKKSKYEELEHKSDEPSVVLPKSVAFIPRKMRGDAGSKNEGRVTQSINQAGSSIGIAVVEVQQDESEMQEDELVVDDVCVKDKYQKPGRRYRSKIEEDDDVC